METTLGQGFDRAMAEITAQRQLFWQPQKRVLNRLPKAAQDAIERGEDLLWQAQRRKLGTIVSLSV